TTAVGGVRLAPLPRPDLASVPTGLRFRFVSAPLWWSSAIADRASGGEERAAASRAVRAANSAAAIWRSIFATGLEEDLSGGMDRRHDEPTRALSGVERRMDVLVSLGLIGGGQPRAGGTARGPETIYVAMDDQGRAGTATSDQVRRGNAVGRPIEMRIVAAIPPSPPPLPSMGAVASPIHPPQALARQRHVPGGEHRAEENVSQSRIEGSVDAIAQRIYHRIRQRIASDRERFGG
ncbi:MAG TPA: hypothetical protein VE964_03985, partial [Myxococcales bacterium]|nr:hypothetical protein [Myxococcales bacterium]